MKKVITLVAAIMLLVTSTLALAGCGGTKTLEEYVNSDSDVQQELSDLESSLGNGGSITVKENNSYETTAGTGHEQHGIPIPGHDR